LFFKPNGNFVDQHSYRFTPTREVVSKEVAAIVSNVGIMEVSGFNRIEIKGPGSSEFLDHLICGALPNSEGKVKLTYLLNENGNVLTEATLARLGEEHYWYGSAAGAEWHDLDWLKRFKPPSITIAQLTASHTILVIAGPQSRGLLQSVSPRHDWSKEAFAWMQVRKIFISHAEVVAMSVSFSGELAYELHVPNENLYLVYTTLTEAGNEYDIKDFGLYATESMRIEKGYRHWKADLIYERNPLESGLERFVDLDKADFVGKAKLLKQVERGPRRQFASMVIDCDVAPVHGGESIYLNNNLIGSVTSGGYGFRVKKNIAYGFVLPPLAQLGTSLEVEILGERYPATVSDACLYDPDNLRVKL
jgi:dimethylglycine dehydrogenase